MVIENEILFPENSKMFMNKQIYFNNGDMYVIGETRFRDNMIYVYKIYNDRFNFVYKIKKLFISSIVCIGDLDDPVIVSRTRENFIIINSMFNDQICTILNMNSKKTKLCDSNEGIIIFNRRLLVGIRKNKFSLYNKNLKTVEKNFKAPNFCKFHISNNELIVVCAFDIFLYDEEFNLINRYDNTGDFPYTDAFSLPNGIICLHSDEDIGLLDRNDGTVLDGLKTFHAENELIIRTDGKYFYYDSMDEPACIVRVTIGDHFIAYDNIHIKKAKEINFFEIIFFQITNGYCILGNEKHTIIKKL